MRTEYGTAAMYQCPRFSRCNAPICPLDPDWRRRSHSGREAVCAWLLEGAKPSWEAVRGIHISAELAEAIGRQAPDIIASHGAIRRTVKRAAISGSRILAGIERLRAKP